MSNTGPSQGPESGAQWAGTRGGYSLEMDPRLNGTSPFTYNHPFPLYWTINPEVPLDQFSMPMGPAGLYTQQYNGFMSPHPMNPAISFAPVAVYPPHEQGKRSHGTSAPRRTLTNDDRRRMCLYHLENPRVKQAEIGKMFGVERSTVSKVLQKKDYFLSLGEETVSPVKRPTRRDPDAEKTLANYIRKNEHRNLTDEAILNTSKSFSRSSNNPETQRKMSDPKWVREFRRQTLAQSGVERSSSVESGPSSAASSDVSTPRTAPEVPLCRDIKHKKLELSPLTDMSPFSQIDMIPNIPTYEDAYPSSEYMQLSLIDPLLFKSEQEARDRTPSLTAMSTTSSVYEQPLDDSLDLGFVSPRVLFRSPPRDSQWQDQEFMFSAPSAKRHCAPGQMIPVKSESECNLFDRAVMKAELESMTVPSATTLYGQIQPSFGTNDLKRRHE